MTSNLITLDGDGVLLDYNEAYGRTWERAFGTTLQVQDESAYYAHDRWGVPWIGDDELEYLQSFMDEEFWSTIPALPGAVPACRDLAHAGHTLVCVSALPSRFEKARLDNLRALGFPIGRVYATPAEGSVRSPKATAIRMLQPLVFVDDYLPYFRSMPDTVHKALILRQPTGSPNFATKDAPEVTSRHHDLPAFVSWWLTAPSLRSCT